MELEQHRERVRQEAAEEAALLQEAGVYQYRHPLSDAVAYQAAVAGVQDLIKSMAKADGGAVHAAQGWTVNGSEAQGRAMIRDFSKRNGPASTRSALIIRPHWPRCSPKVISTAPRNSSNDSRRSTPRSRRLSNSGSP
ncbi:hypothetical protein [Actinoplanes xinjiangensis]|uniref:hypothetical protein n=1 Tax=Actinoplanes xinjiangensis TaxID=512350 RepID=UPI00341D21F5